MASSGPSALERLDQLTRRLRRECPWDREQDERSIVGYTVGEAYELADAAYAGDDEKLVDELGDVLFQVHFLSLLLEERGQGDLAAVADHCTEKLIRRHPHVFGEVSVEGAGDVVRNWDEIKRVAEGRGAAGLFGDLPENLPALSLAAKALRRAEGSGGPAPFAAVAESLARLERESGREENFEVFGDLLFELVRCARSLNIDPEIAVRVATTRFRDGVEGLE
ncbi:MAG TPA: MazG nucleotide pyrophosphohydrolase domain-containing protein [Solirubrobacteraceae bacterium]|jgi:XTP/dITP diphosphohydrolase/tetrapyrrole methylase family protein/MazG family protein/ATP diphosphatase